MNDVNLIIAKIVCIHAQSCVLLFKFRAIHLSAFHNAYFVIYSERLVNHWRH